MLAVSKAAAAMPRDTAPAEAPPDPKRRPQDSGPRAGQLPERPLRRGPGTYDRSQTAEERRAEQRQSLLRAAAQVFARDGFSNASVASILEASGLSRGTFYRHFKDLRDIFLAVQSDAAELLYARIEQAFQSESEPPAKLRAAVTAYLELLAESADLARVFHREALVSGARYAELRRENLGRMANLFATGLREARDQGLISRLPDDTTVYALIVAIEGVGLRYLEEHQEDRAVEAAAPLLRLCFKAFE